MRAFPVLAICLLVPTLSAKDFSIQVVDGLDRPISGANIDIPCLVGKKKIADLRLESDSTGIIRGAYDGSKCQPISVRIQRKGYESYETGFHERYVLHQQFHRDDLPALLKLEGDARRERLRELLAGWIAPDGEPSHELGPFVFIHEAELRPLLRDLAWDPLVTEHVRNILARIGEPDDLRLIMRLPSTQSVLFPERWRYSIATALVNPDDESEWSFLRDCAGNKFDDRWVDAGAIQSLRLTATARSRALLLEIQRQNSMRRERIARALAYIDGNPPPLADTDLKVVAQRVAKAIEIGDVEAIGSPLLNLAGNKALVDLILQTDLDRLTYTATFHKIDGVWTLRGVHESRQAFAPRPNLRPVR